MIEQCTGDAHDRAVHRRETHVIESCIGERLT